MSGGILRTRALSGKTKSIGIATSLGISSWIISFDTKFLIILACYVTLQLNSNVSNIITCFRKLTCLSSQFKVNKVHKHSKVFDGQLLLNIKRKLLYEVRLVKCKLSFIIIGHSGSNHSAFYLNAANSAGLPFGLYFNTSTSLGN